MTPYLHYDVFTDRLFEGNQLAVFTEAAALSAAQMQTIAREMNFSECTFLVPAEAAGTDVRMRIFTPGAELPMAGHPTIGTTFALAETGAIRAGAARFVFGLGIGPTPVELTWRGSALDFAWMDQRPPDRRPAASTEAEILRGIGLDSAARVDGWPIEEVSCGVPYICVPLRSRAEVDRAEPDAGALVRLRSAFEATLPAVYLFAVEPEGSELTAYSRMFAPGHGVIEDPATGSAAGPLGCALVHHRRVAPERWLDMVALQGVRMGRPSRIHIRVHATAPDAITRVQVGGRAVKVGEGVIAI